MTKFEIKLENLNKALKRLKEAAAEMNENHSNDVIRDGLIQRFEFTYELAWKTTKDYLEDIGIMDKNSPKAVFKEAYGQKLIKNEEAWLYMIKDRNMTSHLYQEKMAKEIAERIINCYINEFDKLVEALNN